MSVCLCDIVASTSVGCSFCGDLRLPIIPRPLLRWWCAHGSVTFFLCKPSLSSATWFTLASPSCHTLLGTILELHCENRILTSCFLLLQPCLEGDHGGKPPSTSRLWKPQSRESRVPVVLLDVDCTRVGEASHIPQTPRPLCRNITVRAHPLKSQDRRACDEGTGFSRLLPSQQRRSPNDITADARRKLNESKPRCAALAKYTSQTCSTLTTTPIHRVQQACWWSPATPHSSTARR